MFVQWGSKSLGHPAPVVTAHIVGDEALITVKCS